MCGANLVIKCGDVFAVWCRYGRNTPELKGTKHSWPSVWHLDVSARLGSPFFLSLGSIRRGWGYEGQGERCGGGADEVVGVCEACCDG